MKYLACLMLIILTTSVSFAQEVDSVTTDTEDQSDEGENYSETENNTHTLVDPASLPKTNEYRTEKISIRKFDRKKWKNIVGSTSFNEKEKDRKKQTPQKNLSIPRVPIGGDIIKIIFYAVVFAVFVLIIYMVVKNASSLDYRLKKNKMEGEDISKPIENIEELDIDQLLQQTLAAGNFKLAVRLYYLGLLKKLNEGGMIDWKKDKTNHDYLTEIFSRNFCYNEIRNLTVAYEAIWYGDHGINRETFEQLSLNFEDIKSKINAPQQL